jgi:hypothetical protein
MAVKEYQLNSRNYEKVFDEFNTNKVHDSYIDYSASFTTKTDANKNISHSTESQSRNPSKQALKPAHTERGKISTNLNPNFGTNVKVRSKNEHKLCFDNYARECDGSCISGQKLEKEYEKSQMLESALEEYTASNRKLGSLLKHTQEKIYTLEKQYKI